MSILYCTTSLRFCIFLILVDINNELVILHTDPGALIDTEKFEDSNRRQKMKETMCDEVRPSEVPIRI